ncbi:MAG: ketopantoate reductase family protein [Gammaproteobacteria bacterium]|nr:ketopantoate reductase family protein [Gammaproteobacteria bacterium]MDE2263940.1 ketopantoate reductase family protein [Gammaproteobacteria bacterium]
MTRADFAILGAGAIGSILAAHLARAGHTVTVIARGDRARAVERDGLRIKGLADFSAQVGVITDPSQLQAADTLIVATKTPGTEAALARLKHVRVGAALSIQNGVLKNELLARAFGAQRVLGALADTSGELLPSGEVLFTRNVNLPLGEPAGGISDRARRIAGMIDEAGVRSVAVADIVSMEWSKFTVWLGLMSMAVTMRSVSWRYLMDADCAQVLVRLIREVAAVAAAQGIALVEGAAALPLRTVLEAPEPDAVEAVRKAGEQMRSRAPHHRMSALQDLEAGRPLEVEETFGYAVRKARELGLSLPLLESCHHLVAAIDRIRGAGAS